MTEISELGLSPEQEQIMRETVINRYLSMEYNHFEIFKFEIRIPTPCSVSSIAELTDCCKNIAGYFTLMRATEDDCLVYRFTDENDAMIVKMRFG
jgi:hypothetical protein